MPPSSGNSITAYIKGDTKNLERAASRAQKTIAGIGKGFASILAGGAAFAGIRELDQLARAALSAADEIGKAAKTAGIGANALQEYRYAAEKAGNSQKQLDDAVGRYNRRLGEARNGNRAYAETFAQMGVTVTDTNEKALEKTFEFLGGITDEARRTSYATKVFGDDARRMALLVQGGADALKASRKEAREYGLVLDQDLVKAAEHVKDRMTRLDRQMDTELNTTILKNIDGWTNYKLALNGVQKAAIGALAALGDLSKQGGDLAKGAGLQLLQSELRTLEKQSVRNPQINAEIARLKSEISRIKGELANTPKVTLADINAVVGAPPPVTGGGGFTFKGKIPGAPTLKSDALFKEAEKAQDKIAQIISQTETPLEKLRNQYAELKTLTPFAETPEQVAAIEKAASRLALEMDGLTKKTDQWAQASRDAGRGISDAFAGAIVYGENLGKTLTNISKQLASRLLSNLLFKTITGGSGGLGAIFGGPRAMGGPVSAGRTYLVGERGPELFAPSTNGAIIPNGAMGGGVVVNMGGLHFDVGLESVDSRIAAVTPRIAASVVGAVEKARTRPSYA